LRLEVEVLKRDPRASERGMAVVEGAWCMVAFFTVILGIFEIARFVNVYQVATDAAREGARLAVTPLTQTSTLPNSSEVEAEVRRFLDGDAIQGATVSVGTVNSGVDQFTLVTVTVPYQLMTVSLFSSLQFNLVSNSLMRNETSP
jgi:Flp pilus assembly protein TadG